jgi:hypothetical protein
MKSTRYRPRGVSKEHLDADMTMRRTVRAVIRKFYPGAPRPAGGGWLVAPSEHECPNCTGYLFLVRVPGVEFVQLVYCLDCDDAMELVTDHDQ